MEVWDSDPHNPEMGSWFIDLLCDPEPATSPL